MDAGKCLSCGTTLDAGAPSGRCPKCLLADHRGPRSNEDTAALEVAAVQQGRPAVLEAAAGPREIPPVSEVAWRGAADPRAGGEPSPAGSPPGSPDDGAFSSDRAHVPHIEGYDVLRPLKRGGQGIVYLARQRSTKRKVAIKVLLAGAFASRSARRRFEREIELVAGLKHANVIAVFDSGTTPDGHAYCVMDYVRGVPITQHVREQGLGIRQVLAEFATTCEAVNHAHQRGVIHRDLKPSNILVDVDGNVRVLDFGLAKTMTEPAESVITVTGSVHGTYPYMSPEQTRGNPDEMDTRTDVYSLGVILYEALTGKHPYPITGTVAEVVHHICETPPMPPAKAWTAEAGVRPDRVHRRRRGARVHCPIDADLSTIVLKGLAKERDRRYESAGQFARDVRHYLADEPIVARRPSAGYQLRMFARRHRAMVIASVGILLGLVLGVIATTWVALKLRAANARLLGTTEAIVTSMAFGGDDLAGRDDLIAARRLYMKGLDEASARNFAPSAILAGLVEIGSRDGGQIPLMGTYGSDGGAGGFLGHGGHPQNVAILRAHRMALTGGTDGKLILWELDTGRLVRQIESGQKKVNYVAVAPREDWAVTAGEDGTVRSWDLSTFAEREPHLVLDPPISPRADRTKPEPAWMVAVSKEGGRILAGGNDGEIVVWDQAGGRRVIGRCAESCAGLAFVPGNSRYALSGDHAGIISLWDLEQPQPDRKDLGTQGTLVNSIAFSPNGRKLLSGGFADRTLTLWDVEGEVPDLILTRKVPPIPVGAAIWRVAFSPDGGTVAAACEDGRVSVNEVATGAQLHLFRAQTRKSMGVEFLDNQTLVSTGDDEKDAEGRLVTSALMVWDVGRPARVPAGSQVSGLSVNDTGGVRIEVAPGHVPDMYIGQDGALHGARSSAGPSAPPWEPVSSTKEGIGSANWALGRRSGVVSAASAARAGADRPPALARLAEGDALLVPDDRAFQLWVPPLAAPGDTTGAPVPMRVFRGHRGRVTAAAVSPNGRYIVSADDQGTLLAWDLFRPLRSHELELKLRGAHIRLNTAPADPASLSTLEEWFAFRGRDMVRR